MNKPAAKDNRKPVTGMQKMAVKSGATLAEATGSKVATTFGRQLGDAEDAVGDVAAKAGKTEPTARGGDDVAPPKLRDEPAPKFLPVTMTSPGQVAVEPSSGARTSAIGLRMVSRHSAAHTIRSGTRPSRSTAHVPPGFRPR